MFQSVRKPLKNSSSLSDTNNGQGMSVIRTEGMSVSTIKNFMFGDRNGSGWRLNSLPHPWKRKSFDLGSQNKSKSPSFKSYKKNFFHSWSKSSRYVSTPDLNVEYPENEVYMIENFPERTSVKKMVLELEKSSTLKSSGAKEKRTSCPKRIASFNHSEISYEPDVSVANPTHHHEPKIESRCLNSLKKATSLHEIKENLNDGYIAIVSNPLYTDVTTLNNTIKDQNSGTYPSENSPETFGHSTSDELFQNYKNSRGTAVPVHLSATPSLQGSAQGSNISAIPKVDNCGFKDEVCFSEIKLSDAYDSNLFSGNDEDKSQNIISSESGVNEKTVVVQEPGRFLARWVPLEDLSSRNSGDPATDGGGGAADNDTSHNASVASPTASEIGSGSKARRPTERRESGRFHSAARILRSLGRSRGEEVRKECYIDGDGVTGSLDRVNPHYHSEGKGSKKKKSDREKGGGSHKERSRSFCEKPESKKKFFSQQQENKLLRQQAKARLFREENLSSQLPGEGNEDERRLSASPPLIEGSSHGSSERTVDEEPQQRLYDTSRRGVEPEGEGSAPKLTESEDLNEPVHLEREDKERRSARKLTKDSGYETSPYTDGDYANLDVIAPPEREPASPNHPTRKISGSGIAVENEAADGVDGSPAERISVKAETEVADSENISTSNELSNSPPADDESYLSEESPRYNSNNNNNTSSSLHSTSFPSGESLTKFANSLIVSSPAPSQSSSLVPARSTPSLSQHATGTPSLRVARNEEAALLNEGLQASKSTPNLEETPENDTMVTKKLSMYSYISGSSPQSGKKNFSPNRTSDKRFFDPAALLEDSFNQTDYAHHIRSSSYHILHSRQHSSGSYHSRQASNTSNYSEEEDGGSCRDDLSYSNSNLHPSLSNNLMDRSRCFSYDGLGFENSSQSISWNASEPDLTMTSSTFSISHKYEKSQLSPSTAATISSVKTSPSNSAKLPSSPPPPPVRDASSLKYIRYGPGHEKFPSWPVPAGATSLVLPQNHPNNQDGNESGLGDSSSSYLSPPQGSHRSHSWTEQSEYPKDKSGGYARPFLKRQFSPSFQKQLLTVMEKCEKISPEVFKSRHAEDVLRAPSYSLIDSYLQQSTYYPPFDREGRCIDDKDYSIPSPPERDPGMGEAHLSQVTAAQLEEHARRCDFSYSDFPHGDFPQVTPLLDQLRQESYSWDGSSERDSGRGESESLTDSRYSNGRESVTTVVTNSSSASSSETLKWHGSLSDVSIMSGHSKEVKGDQNIAHSSRVQVPQRQNSESVLFYGRGKHFPSKGYDSRISRDGGYARPYRDGKWSREIERNNEVNNLKKFPSYSYTQPLTQISEAPLAESREALHSSGKSPKSPTIDFSKPPSVAERINELEKQSRPKTDHARWPRDQNEPREIRFSREEHHRALELCQEHNSQTPPMLRPSSSERDNRLDSSIRSEQDLKSPSSANFRSPVNYGSKPFRCSMRRDSDESIGFSDSSHLSFNDIDRSLNSSSTSYTYLDPEKRCKVPDATLKSIQKQALLSFYERRTGKSFNSTLSPSSSSTSSLLGADLNQSDRGGKSLLREKSKSGKGMARLGRVPDSEKCDESEEIVVEPSTQKAVGPRLSFNGHEGCEDGVGETLDVPQGIRKLQNSTAVPEKSHNDAEEFILEQRQTSLTTAPEDFVPPLLILPPTGATSLPHLHQEEKRPPLPPSPDDAPPKPPDRPPKKPNLRSLFHHAPPDEPPSPSPSPSSRPYFYYRKPPAPDPPESPPPPITGASSSSSSSRSPTPELPPPPPPPLTEEEEVVVSDEPLPPPPSQEEETRPEDGNGNLGTPPPVPPSARSSNETYHKDSYMAHRKDWKTGYEGRYRRTHSPSPPERARDSFKSSQPITKPISKPVNAFHNSGNLRSAVSTSSLLRPSSSPVDNECNLNSLNYHHNNNNNNGYSNTNNNGWRHQVRQKSTTVNFTAEELRAFKARRAAHGNHLSSTGELRDEPPAMDTLHAPLRPLSRAFSMGEPFHVKNSEELSETTKNKLYSESDSNTPPPHDGPITAHPAKVTENGCSRPSSPSRCLPITSLSLTSLSEDSSNSQSQSLLSSTSSSTLSPANSSTTSLSPSSSSSTLVSSSKSDSPVLTTALTTTTTTQPLSVNKPDYLRSLSSTGTCPSMTLPNCPSEELVDRDNIVVLTYGRTPKPEVVDCDRLSMEFVTKGGNIDSKLQALLAPNPPYKSMGSYMDGVFTLEMRKDLLCSSHASHPDLLSLVTENQFLENGVLGETKNLEYKTNDKAPLPADSLYFTTSESKAKFLSRIRDGSSKNDSESQHMDSISLSKKKEELLTSISRKLDILKSEKSIINSEMSQNFDIGSQVTGRVELRAKTSEVDKYKLHVEEIDKITSLLLGLSGRLARAENALLLLKEDEMSEQKRILEGKRDKLNEQLEEAKNLKENIDRRAIQVSKILAQYLTEEEYADYDHFIKMKVKLLMDSKEIDDKIKLGEEQLQALANS